MNQPLETRHLTDEQFTDLLLGAAPAEVQAHLGQCSQCAEEANRVCGAIASFQQQSRVWAERRSAASAILTAERRAAFSWFHLPQAWATAAVMFALAAGVGLAVREHHPPQHPDIAAVSPPAQTTAASLKADNALLAAIDGELRADESTPASVYSLTRARRGDPARSAKRMESE